MKRSLTFCWILFVFLLACSRSKAPEPASPSQSPAGSTAVSPAAPAPPASGAAVSGTKLSMDQLQKLVAPIALYPDPLLAQVLPAATYPLEIVSAARIILSDQDASKIDSQNWDPSVKAVAHYPSVLKMMNDQLSWTQQLGQAVMNQQRDVLQAVQNLRAQANQKGNLKTTPQQTVTTTDNKIAIVPADPQVIYVPSYDPAVVYTSTAADVVAPLVTFGTGLAMGAWMGTGFYWPHNSLVYAPGWGAYGYYGGWGHGWNNVNINVNNYNWNNVNWNNYNHDTNQWNHDVNRDNPDTGRVGATGIGTTAPASSSIFSNEPFSKTGQSLTSDNLGGGRSTQSNLDNFQKGMGDAQDRGADSDKVAGTQGVGDNREGNLDAGRSDNLGSARSDGGAHDDNQGMFGDRGGGSDIEQDSMRGYQSRGNAGGYGSLGGGGFGDRDGFGDGGGGFGREGFGGGGGGFRGGGGGFRGGGRR